MSTVNIHQAKTHLSRLIEKAAQGETTIISKAGKPVAKLAPLDAPAGKSRKRIGFLKGTMKVPADFDRMGEKEIERLFGGKS